MFKCIDGGQCSNSRGANITGVCYESVLAQHINNIIMLPQRLGLVLVVEGEPSDLPKCCCDAYPVGVGFGFLGLGS